MLEPRLAALVLLAAPLIGQDPDPWAERRIATIPEGVELASTSRGPDGKDYTANVRFAFGAGGRFVAYAAWRDGKSVAMVDDKELGTFHYLHQPVMDPAREHYAFRAGDRVNPTTEKWWALVDGKKSRTFAWIGAVALGAEGAPLYWEQPGAKVQKDGAYNNSSMLFHFGRRKGKKFESAMSLIEPVVSADGKTALTVALRGRQWFAITATSKRESVGRQGFAAIENAALSPDGKRVALCIVEGGMPVPPGAPLPPGATRGSYLVAVDGETYGGMADAAGAPVFAQKGKRFAFKYVVGRRMNIAFDDDKQLPVTKFDFVGTPVFDPEGKEVAFMTCNGGSIDDYARLMYWGDDAIKGGTYSLQVRKHKGQAEPVVEGVDGIQHPTYGADGKLAYTQLAKGRWYVMVGDRRSEGFDQVGPPVFSADGKQIAFGARQGRELWWRILAID